MRIKMWVSALALMAAAGCSDGGDDGAGGGDNAGSNNVGSNAADAGGDVPEGSDAPRDATIEAFCASFEATSGFISGEDAAVILVETGTPPDIPEDARRGFEYLIDHPEGGKDVITNEDVGTYVTYGSTTCADLINE